MEIDVSHTIKSPRKLIEVALPLDDINAAARREKSIRHGHPSTLHLWWARRPLAAARAVVFAQMVNDPSETIEGDKRTRVWKDKVEAERERLFAIIRELVKWENTNNEDVLEAARAEIRTSWRFTCELNKKHPQAGELFDPDKLPAFHDPFAGGGAIPLEAQRLGLEAHASDLNPVAVLINKAMIEIPPKFAGQAPVWPGSRASRPLTPRRQHKNWHSCGYLPHCDVPGRIQSITFRLGDALPKDAIARLATEADTLDQRNRVEKWLHAGYGECLLARQDVAAIVENALLHFDGPRYRLLAWCVMPNHVHVLIETHQGYPLGGIVHSWKSFTATAINRLLGRAGSVWHKDYFDRYIRDDAHLAAVIEYIEQNPVQAGLVARAAQWPFGSAGEGRDGARETRAIPEFEDWSGARGLAEDVRRYGHWMREEAEKRIGHLYPKVAITAEMAESRKDLQPYVGQKLTVIAWLWARTVKSPNPAFADVDVPLVSNFMLSTKKGKEAWVEPIVEGGGYRFEVRTVAAGDGRPPAEAKKGTKASGRGANFLCLVSDTPVSGDYIKAEGQAGRMGQRLMAVVAEGNRGRVYLSPTEKMQSTADSAEPMWKPSGDVPARLTGGTCYSYGLISWGDLFTPRQLVALNTFSDLVGEARDRVRADAIQAGMTDDERPLAEGGCGATAYAEAISTYLALATDKSADYNSTICGWISGGETLRNTFGRQAIPMVWDYCEANITGRSTGSFVSVTGQMHKAIALAPAISRGRTEQADAQTVTTNNCVVSTDPPYYDNIGYADLSDFFYVWLRRAARTLFPNLFATLAVPKAEELVATSYRHGGRDEAERFFLEGMTSTMHNLVERAHAVFPVTIYYAFKQSETNQGDTTSTGWVTFLEAVLRAGFAIVGTWPMRTEREGRSIGIGSNALASSIVLVCRPRAADAPSIARRDFLRELKAEIAESLEAMLGGEGGTSPIAPVDLAQAAIGPGMAVFSKYASVLEADGSAMSVHDALVQINRAITDYLTPDSGNFDADTQFCASWFEQYGWRTGSYGEGDVLARAKGTSVDGVATAGVVESGGGKVRLLKWNEIDADWDPQRDDRIPVWEAAHQMIRRLHNQGETAAAELLARMPEKGEPIRQLAYHLYTLCERQQWAEEARAYNELIGAWHAIVAASHEIGHRGVQQDLAL